MTRHDALEIGARYATEWAERQVSIRARIDNVFNVTTGYRSAAFRAPTT
jgi:hypothetical protein